MIHESAENLAQLYEGCFHQAGISFKICSATTSSYISNYITLTEPAKVSSVMRCKNGEKNDADPNVPTCNYVGGNPVTQDPDIRVRFGTKWSCTPRLYDPKIVVTSVGISTGANGGRLFDIDRRGGQYAIWTCKVSGRYAYRRTPSDFAAVRYAIDTARLQVRLRIFCRRKLQSAYDCRRKLRVDAGN